MTERTKHTWWHNETPITELYEALNFLADPPEANDPIHLFRKHERDGGGFELRIPWYHEGSSGGDSSGINYYQIGSELAQRLIDEQLVAPRKVPRWGYTEVREDEFVRTEQGYRLWHTHLNQMEEKAESLLIPGTHTDLTGRPHRVRMGREHFRHGRLRFDYQTPTGDIVYVFPEEGKIEMAPNKAA